MSDYSFDDETMGVLVAGRYADSGSLTRAEISTLAAAVDALGKQKNLPLELVPSGDLTDTGPSDDEECYATMAIGLTALRGGSNSPEAIDLDQLLGKLNAAKALGDDVWKELAALLPESSREDFLAQPIGVNMVCVGPLAAAYVAFGTQGTEEDGGDGEYIRGQDMSQEPHQEGVWGQRVAGCEFEGSGHEAVDFSESAHQARLAAFPGGSYFVIGRYD